MTTGLTPQLSHHGNNRLDVFSTLERSEPIQDASSSHVSCSVSDSLQPGGLQPARLLCPWHSPGKNTGVGCHSLLQRIFPTQRSNPDLLHFRQIQVGCRSFIQGWNEVNKCFHLLALEWASAFSSCFEKLPLHVCKPHSRDQTLAWGKAPLVSQDNHVLHSALFPVFHWQGLILRQHLAIWILVLGFPSSLYESFLCDLFFNTGFTRTVLNGANISLLNNSILGHAVRPSNLQQKGSPGCLPQ